MITENQIEQECINWFKNQGYNYAHGNELNHERNDATETVLRNRLKQALKRLNSKIPEEDLELAIDQIINPKPANLTEQNKDFHNKLVKGLKLTYKDPENNDQEETTTLKLIDLACAQNNDYLVANQFVVKGKKGNRRPDLIVFINGLPLFVIELKKPGSEHTDIMDAYSQLQTYKNELQNLFIFNEALIVSDCINARIGSLTANFSRFTPWRTRDTEEDQPDFQYQLKTTVEGFFKRDLILDYLKHFILFEQSNNGLIKKIACYHQFHAVRTAFASTLKASNNQQETQAAEPYPHHKYSDKLAKIELGSGQAGVIWHTQGSGKSISMVCYASKIMQDAQMNNPTIVVVTDRTDLDDQLFNNFKSAQDLLNEVPQQANNRDDLRYKVDGRKVGGIIFTTIQKFGLEAGEDTHPSLSSRSNIVVIADEAHRSHYGYQAKLDTNNQYRYGYAEHMRKAMPNATFIGFTGTPIDGADKSTRRVFGDYISIYDIQNAIEDGTTVPLYYESRMAKLKLNPDENQELNRQVNEVLQGETARDQEKIKAEWAGLKKLIGAKERIKIVAKDIVNHFENTDQVFESKAMIVCMSREICVKTYNAITQIRPGWHNDDPKKGKIKIMMTGAANDAQELQDHIYGNRVKKDIEARFKNENDPLKLVIVRDMWLTGFDVPCCSTMYIDKPMQGHNLMQAIARINRVYYDKKGGNIIDYIGIRIQLQQAMQVYSDSGGGSTPVLPAKEIFNIFKDKIDVIRNLFNEYVDGKTVEYLTTFEKNAMGVVRTMINHIAGLTTNRNNKKIRNGKTRYLDALAGLKQAYSLCQTFDEIDQYKKEIALYDYIKNLLTKDTALTKKQKRQETESKMQVILDNAIKCEDVKSLGEIAGFKQSNIDILSNDFLEEVAELKTKNTAVELLKKLMRDKIKSAGMKNKVVQRRKYSKLLKDALERYHNHEYTAEQTIEELIGIAKEIRADNKKADELGLGSEELAFYHALADNESAEQEMGCDSLKALASELTEKIRKSVTVDWQNRESVRAEIRIIIRRLLKKHKYPPDKSTEAVKQVLEQAEVIAEDIAT